MKYKCKSPVLIIIFNRPDFVKNLIDILREVQPTELYVAADGPRDGNAQDIERCHSARNEIESVDWECKIHKKYSDKNLGCGFNPSDGITWALNNSGESIILEDDCMPSIDFFKYCDELLEKYREDDRVMMISGNNHTLGKCNLFYSYAFSHHTQTYGWATWDRAWKKYDLNMELWPEVRSYEWIESWTGSKKSAKYWHGIFDMCYNKELESAWDYQWTFCCWINHGLNIIPKVNLVSNIGFTSEGTHTTDADNLVANVPVVDLEFPLTHPTLFQHDIDLDRVLQVNIYTPSIQSRVISKITRKFKHC